MPYGLFKNSIHGGLFNYGGKYWWYEERGCRKKMWLAILGCILAPDGGLLKTDRENPTWWSKILADDRFFENQPISMGDFKVVKHECEIWCKIQDFGYNTCDFWDHVFNVKFVTFLAYNSYLNIGLLSQIFSI